MTSPSRRLALRLGSRVMSHARGAPVRIVPAVVAAARVSVRKMTRSTGGDVSSCHALVENDHVMGWPRVLRDAAATRRSGPANQRASHARAGRARVRGFTAGAVEEEARENPGGTME